MIQRRMRNWLTLAIALVFVGAASYIGFVDTAAQDGGLLSLFPITVTLEEAEDGWQDFTIGFGIRNGTPVSQTVYFPAYEKAAVTIAEGRTYDATLSLDVAESFNQARAQFYTFQLPSGAAICGITDSGYANIKFPYPLTVTGRIPEATTFGRLEIAGFLPADLSVPSMPEACQSDTSALPSNAAAVEVGSEERTPFVELLFRLEEAAQRLSVDVTNRNRFDDLFLSSFRVWVGYDNGVWAAPVVAGRTGADESCQLRNPMPLQLGPSQDTTFDLCVPPHGSGSIVAVSASAFDGEFPGIPNPEEGGLVTAVRTGDSVQQGGEAPSLDVQSVQVNLVEMNGSGVSAIIILEANRGTGDAGIGIDVQGFSGSSFDLAFVEVGCEAIDASAINLAFGGKGIPVFREMLPQIAVAESGRLFQSGTRFDDLLATPHVAAIIYDDQVLACGPITADT